MKQFAVLLLVVVSYVTARTHTQQPTALVPRLNMSDSGPETSSIGWGILNINKIGDPQKVLTLVQTLVDAGVTLIDTADVYGGGANVPLLGEALALSPGLREKLQIVCKFNIRNNEVGFLDSSRKYMFDRIRWFMDNLQTDYCDVFMFHAPDALMDPEEVADTVRDLIFQGKIRHFGVSNYPIFQYELLNDALKARGLELVALEAEVSVLTPTAIYDSRADIINRKHQSILAWGALGGDPLGLPNRLFVNNIGGDQQKRILNQLNLIGAEIGAAPDQVAVAWLLRHPAKIIPLLGSTRADRLALQAKSYKFVLTEEQWTRITGASGTDRYERWEQLHAGQWHDIVNDYIVHTYGTPFGDNKPGFTDFN